jgi:hypothetical protein
MLDEVEERARLARRVVALVAEHRQDPTVPLLGEHRQAGGPTGLGPDAEELRAAQRPGTQAQVPGRVLEVDREPLFRRRLVAGGRQPGGRAAAAPGRVDDQVGDQDLLGRGAGVAAARPHPGDAIARRGRHQPGDVTAVDDLDRGERPDPGPHMRLQVGPAPELRHGPVRAALEAERMTTRGKPELREVADHRRAAGHQLVEQPGEQSLEDLHPAWHQQVGMPAMGDAPPVPGPVRERVAFHHRHPPVRVAQHPGGEEPADAGPEDHRVPTIPPHAAPPALASSDVGGSERQRCLTLGRRKAHRLR